MQYTQHLIPSGRQHMLLMMRAHLGKKAYSIIGNAPTAAADNASTLYKLGCHMQRSQLEHLTSVFQVRSKDVWEW